MATVAPIGSPAGPRWISAACGYFALIAGLTGLLGWIANIPVLTDWDSDGINIKANATVAVAAAGGALIAFVSIKSPEIRRAVVLVLAVLVALIGAVTLIEHISGWDFGVDTLLADEPPNQRATSAPGRMGLPATISFILIGTALVLATRSRFRGVSVAASVIVLALCLLSLVGYAFGATSAYTLPRLTGIALQTALTIFVLAVGIIASVPEREPMRTILSDTAAGMLVRRVLPLIIVLPILLGGLRIYGQEIELFDLRFGTAARTVVEVILLAALLWWAAASVEAHEVRLRDSQRRKDEFLAILAHELRNPIAAIRNNLELMRVSGGTPDTVRQSRDVLDRQSAHLARLVDDLLDAGRITTGKIELRREPVELSAIVNQAVEAVRPLCQKAGLELTLKSPSNPIFVNGDPARITQIVGNLLNNACKFTDKGDHVDVSVGSEDENAVVRVRDTGIGIAPEQLEKLFDMFVQADTTLERATSGLGIGLSLVKDLAEMHGGAVEVRSAGLRAGSEFIVRLPQIPEPAALPAGTPKDKGSVAKTNGDKPVELRRVLVVDDNVDSAEALAMILKIKGNEVQIAYDGLEAVELANVFRPNAIILDIGLPRLNGYEAAREIRRQEWGSETVLIALTGWGQQEDRQRSKDAGFDSHMVKPVDYERLIKQLDELAPARSSAAGNV